MSTKRARMLQQDAAFQSAFKTAVEAYRATLEPGNLAMALEIRDDRLAKPKERIRAGEFLRGPKAAPGVTVNVQQNNGQPQRAGYVINLGTPLGEIERESKIVDVTPREGNAGNIAADAAQEQASARR